ncbi:MAG: hypothetical protein V2A66_03450 [Pseudomonadota bacterium]
MIDGNLGILSMRRRLAAKQSIVELARATQHLARRAVQEYVPVVEDILSTGCSDNKHIEHTLDGLLDFSFDPNVLLLYKKLCRYYYDINPSAAISYVQAYREMWDSEPPGQGQKGTTKT